MLLIFKNHYMFGTRLRVGHLIPLAVALYTILIGYQLALMEGYFESGLSITTTLIVPL